MICTIEAIFATGPEQAGISGLFFYSIAVTSDFTVFRVQTEKDVFVEEDVEEVDKETVVYRSG